MTPTRSETLSFEQTTKVCYDYTINGLKIMASVANSPFRFVYTSGVTVERDQSKTLPFLHDYRLMRVRCHSISHFALLTLELRVVWRMPFSSSPSNILP